jgi:hypothetical protein
MCLLLITSINSITIQASARNELDIRDCMKMHAQFLFIVPTAGCNQAAVGDAVTGTVNTASDEIPVLIRSSSKCQRPSWNPFLKVTHEANLSHSYTLPSTQLV